MSPERVRIRYHRPPDRETVFEQVVVHREEGVVVTLLEGTELPGPLRVSERPVLEPGAPVVWFTYPGRWHDIGRFHLVDGTYTGTYANILTPVRMEAGCWETTDLFLDVWSAPGAPPRVLDREELGEAARRGWLDPSLCARAREEAARIVRAARTGHWPGPEVGHWTLARSRATLQDR